MDHSCASFVTTQIYLVLPRMSRWVQTISNLLKPPRRSWPPMPDLQAFPIDHDEREAYPAVKGTLENLDLAVDQFWLKEVHLFSAGVFVARR